jgi:lipopolysaccharide heptosyltransferase I
MPGWRRCPLHRLDARRIAILKPSALGDIVHALPVLTALRRRFPNAFISWIVNRAYQSLLDGHPDLDETLAFDRGAARHGLLRALASYRDFAVALRQRRFDLVIDLQGLFRSGVMALVTGARRRVGLGCAREGARWFYTDVVPVPDSDHSHAVDRCWRVAEALGAADEPPRFVVPVAAEARLWAERQLTALPQPWLALAVGSRWLTKRWPPEHFAVLAEHALRRRGGSAVFVGSAEESSLADQVAARLAAPTLNLSGRTTLPQLAALLQRADVLLANDTGPLHLAVALGRPVVAPYTCTKTALNGPYRGPFGSPVGGAVETGVACGGSYLRRCPTRMECMTELTPARLTPLLDEVLAAWSFPARSA